MSSAIVLAIWFMAVAPLYAHEIRPAISDVTVGAERVEMQIELTLESLVAGIDLQGLEDTDAAPEAAQYDALRAMSAGDLEAVLREAWPTLRRSFALRAGETPLAAELTGVDIPSTGDLDLPRDSRITIQAALPADGTAVTIGWAAANGPLVVRQTNGGDDAYSALLQDGNSSAPMLRAAVTTEGPGTVFLRFVVQGFEHIIPKGVDHIVFVLGLFFFSLHLRPMLVQITSFTLAHTVTLALAALGHVTIPASVVEPLIAASIVFVAIENILRPQLGPWRTAVVFVFGLLHGLGFASVLGELGGGQAHFLARLVGFNIGVEIGQLTVILAAYLTVGLWFGKKTWYRRAIAVPASVLIAAVGTYWFIERVTTWTA